MVIVLLLTTIVYFLLVCTGLHNRTLTTRNGIFCVAFYVAATLLCTGEHFGWVTTRVALILIGVQALTYKVLGWEPIVPQWKGRFPWR